jgi:ABC-type nickel/cobalt efflux system permease component RcnA
MSMSGISISSLDTRRELLPRMVLAGAAVCLMAGIVALLARLALPAMPQVAPHHPFGVGIREATPTARGLGGIILAIQSAFYQSLQSALTTMKQNGSAVWSLVSLGSAYGVFHAAGPGHGKGVIAAYIVADERALRKGVALSVAAALLQAAVAIALVSLVAVVLNATAATMSQVAGSVETTSFAVVTALGAALVWRKSARVFAVARVVRDPHAAPAMTCDHVHLPGPAELDRMSRWREMAGVVLSAGIRPCAGAIVILVFALSQGLFAAGIAATIAMALGTALTTSAIAALAVFAKSLALRMAGGHGTVGPVAVAVLELLAAAFVLVLGISLLSGLWASGGG